MPRAREYPQSPDSIRRNLEDARTQLEQIEGDLTISRDALREVKAKLVAERAATNKPNVVDGFLEDIRDLDNELNRLRRRQEKLAATAEILTDREDRLTEIEPKSLTELYEEHAKLLKLYETGRAPTTSPKGAELQESLVTVEREGKHVLSRIVPGYRSQKPLLDKITAEGKKAGINTTAFEAAASDFEAKADAYRKTDPKDTDARDSADEAVITSKTALRAALASIHTALKAALLDENTKNIPTGTTVSTRQQMEEQIVWVEHLIADRIGKNKTEKEAYIDKIVKEQTVGISRSNAEKRIATEQKQEEFAREFLRSLGVPLKKDDLQKLFHERETAAKAAAGGKKYTEKTFGEELADEISYQVDPELVAASKRDEIAARVKARKLPNTSYDQALLSVFGMVADPSSTDTDQRQPLVAFLKAHVQSREEKAAGRSKTEWKLGGDEASIAAFIARFKDGLKENDFKEMVLDIVAKNEKPSDNRRLIEAELTSFKAQVDKALALEKKDEELEDIIDREGRFIKKGIGGLQEKLAEPKKLRGAAERATEHQERIRENRAVTRAERAQQLEALVSTKRTRVEEIDARLSRITEELVPLEKAERSKQVVFEEKQKLDTALGLLLGKTFDSTGAGKFSLKDRSIFNVGAKEAEILKSKEVLIKRTLSNSVVEEITPFAAMRVYKDLEDEQRGFFVPGHLDLYPKELTSKDVGWLRTHYKEIDKKCEHIACADPLAVVAKTLLAYNAYPPPLFQTPPILTELPVPPEPKQPPEPEFFERHPWGKTNAEKLACKAKVDAYDKWKTAHETWYQTNKTNILENQRRRETFNELQKRNDENAQADDAMRKAWTDNLKALAHRMKAEAGALTPTIDLSLDGNQLREEVARGCLEALKPLLFDHPFTGKTALEQLKSAEARLAEYILPPDGGADKGAARKAAVDALKKYGEVRKRVEIIVHERQEEDEIALQLTAYLRKQALAKTKVAAELATAKRELISATDPVTRLKQEKTHLEEERKLVFADQQTLMTDKVEKLNDFDNETKHRIDSADPEHAIEAWEKYAYDHTRFGADVQEGLEENVKEAITQLIEVRRLETTYPLDAGPASVAYSTARHALLVDAEKIHAFLAKCGKTVAEGLNGDLPTLKRRLEKAFARDNSEKKLFEEIQNAFPILKEPLKKTSRPTTTS